MPRTHTPTERSLLGGAAFNVHARLDVFNASGQIVDVGNLGGVNWFKSARVGGKRDDPVMSGTIALRREYNGASLSPLMASSALNRDASNQYAPLLYAGRRFRFHTACTAAGVAPVTGDWREIVRGKIDRVNWGGRESTVELSVRDEGAFLQETWIETPTVYSTPGGVAVETIMQQILNQWMGVGAYTLYTPVSPGWVITEYEQQMMSVFDAISALALQIGWFFRFKYDASHVFRPTFYNPRAVSTTPSLSFGPTEYLDVRDVNLDDARIRNVVRVFWTP